MKAVRYHCSLHEDLIIEVLLKLSVKSLLRFKSVCQHWHKIITSANFVRNHFRRESNSTTLLVYSKRDYFVGDLFSMFNVETLERYEDVYPRELNESIRCIRGPCNGIFCVFYLDFTMVLWNPATRRVRPVPRAPIRINYLRFGMDPLTDDIKIVLIDIARKHVAIYSFTDDSWSVHKEEFICKSCDYMSCDYCNDYRPTLSNGFCYWLRHRSSTNPHTIIGFDMHNELFQEIEMPECIFGSVKTIKLIPYGDTLTVSTYNIVAGKERHDIWIFKEQCWVKIVTFSPPQTMVIRRVAGVWKRNQIVVVTDRKLVIYDTDAGNTRTFEFQYIENSRHYAICPFMYKESLVSL